MRNRLFVGIFFLLQYSYCAVAYKGDKIDCSEDTLSNYLTGTKVGEAYLVTFKSGFDYERGNDTALIIYNEKQKTLSWFRKTSNLIAYVPDHAILR
jgi:hypothetical protein